MKNKKKVTSWEIIGKIDNNTNKLNQNKINTDNIYIPSLQAKDIFLSKANSTEIQFKNNKNEFLQKRFICTFDYSKEQVKLREVFESVYNNKEQLIVPLYNVKNEVIKIFSDSIISVSFNYACKSWNQANIYDDKGKKYKVLIKYGEYVTYDQFENCLAYKDDNLIAVIVDMQVDKINNDICLPFYVENNTYKIYDNKKNKQYYELNDEELELNGENMRTILYVNGFDYNKKHYVRYKRASGASRKGTILFIDQKLYPQMREYELMGLDIKSNKIIDLAGEEAYISLTMSGSEEKEKIYINKDEILFVPDLHSCFKSNCIAVSNQNSELYAENKEVNIKNNLIDGEALIEAEIIKGYGMALLRERWFKSCAFATYLQTFFADNGITDITQLNGITLAKDISQIKLIINSSCIKMLKFDNSKDAVLNWLNNIDGEFYVVKHEHKTKFFDNRMVQTHYQLLNTIQLDKRETQELIKPSLDYINLINTDVNVFKHYISANFNNIDKELDKVTLNELLNINENAFYTDLSATIRNKIRKTFKDNLLQGHILIKGNYSVLFGNPLSYLYHTINKSDEANEIVGNQCMTTNKNFNYNEKVVLCRSPHVFAGNLALLENVYVAEIDKYFYLTDNIICINAKKENIMERLSSCDYDSDQAIVTNEKLIVKAVEKNYNKFGVPTSLVEPSGSNKYYYTPYDLSKLDNNIMKQSSTIGDIINTSQLLQSVMWDRINNNDNNIVDELINDCALLDVMSCICIDSAKKDYSNINLKKELDRVKSKYSEYITNSNQKSMKPNFFTTIEELKKFKKQDDRYCHFNTTMCYVYELISKHRTKPFNNDMRCSLSDIFNITFPCNKDKITKNQIIDILKEAEELQKRVSNISSNKKDGWFGYYLKEVNAYYDYIHSLKINIFTAYKLIRLLDRKDKKIKNISKFVTVALLSHKKVINEFLNQVQIQDYFVLEETNDYEYDYAIYNLKFKKILKNPLLQIEIA